MSLESTPPRPWALLTSSRAVVAASWQRPAASAPEALFSCAWSRFAWPCDSSPLPLLPQPTSADIAKPMPIATITLFKPIGRLTLDVQPITGRFAGCNHGAFWRFAGHWPKLSRSASDAGRCAAWIAAAAACTSYSARL